MLRLDSVGRCDGLVQQEYGRVYALRHMPLQSNFESWRRECAKPGDTQPWRGRRHEIVYGLPLSAFACCSKLLLCRSFLGRLLTSFLLHDRDNIVLPPAVFKE